MSALQRPMPRIDVQLVAHVLVVELHEPAQSQAAANDRLCEPACVLGLLAAEPDRTQLRIIELEKFARRQRRCNDKQTIECCAGRRDRNLLLEDDVQQGRKPGRSLPKGWAAVAFVDAGQIPVAAHERA